MEMEAFKRHSLFKKPGLGKQTLGLNKGLLIKRSQSYEG